MGWTAEGISRNQVTKKQMGPWTTVSGTTVTATKHHRNGDEDWFLYELRDLAGQLRSSAISVTLWEGNFHKEISEEGFPYCFGCPVDWLNEVPVTCEEWRRAVLGKAAA